jgi:hypothetical protein
MRNFAKRIIACEANGPHSANGKIPEAFPVFEKLRPQLTTLMGNGGFRVLLSRALTLARPEAPWLRTVHVKSDGALGASEEIHAQLSSDAMITGREALLAELLGLLETFIGENLTLRLVLEVWPDAHFNDRESAKGHQNEEQS